MSVKCPPFPPLATNIYPSNLALVRLPQVARAASDRLESVLLGLQQGANGMHTRVQPYLHLTDGGVFELTQSNDDSQPWADTLEHLSLGEQVRDDDDDDDDDDRDEGDIWTTILLR